MIYREYCINDKRSSDKDLKVNLILVYFASSFYSASAIMTIQWQDTTKHLIHTFLQTCLRDDQREEVSQLHSKRRFSFRTDRDLDLEDVETEEEEEEVVSVDNVPLKKRKRMMEVSDL